MAKKRTKKRKNSREIGHRHERALVKKFSKWWGSEFFRTPGSGAFATRGFDAAKYAGDILTEDKTFPFCVESKKGEGWHLEQLLTSEKCIIWKWWSQAAGETPPGKEPLLVFTRNRQPYFFMMRMRTSQIPGALYGFVTTIVHEEDTLVIGLLEDLFDTSPSSWMRDVEED